MMNYPDPEHCDHQVVEAASDCMNFVCSDCGSAVIMRTKSGTLITPQMIDKWILDEGQAT